MPSGIPFELPSAEDLMALAVKYKGNVHAIARELKITEHTLYSHFKENPGGKQIIDFVRGFNTYSDLDLGEYVNRYNMTNYKENPSLAQRAAEFTLMSKGKERGFVRQQTDDYVAPKEENIQLKQENYVLKHEIKEIKKQLDDYKRQTSQELQRSDT